MVAFCLPTCGTIFMANINWPVYRESQRVEGKKPPQRRGLSNFFPSLDSLPATATRLLPSPLIRERVSGREKNLHHRWKQQIRSPARESTIETINSPCMLAFFFFCKVACSRATVVNLIDGILVFRAEKSIVCTVPLKIMRTKIILYRT